MTTQQEPFRNISGDPSFESLGVPRDEFMTRSKQRVSSVPTAFMTPDKQASVNSTLKQMFKN